MASRCVTTSPMRAGRSAEIKTGTRRRVICHGCRASGRSTSRRNDLVELRGGNLVGGRGHSVEEQGEQQLRVDP